MKECVCERDRGGDKERKNEEMEKGRTAIKWRKEIKEEIKKKIK